MQRRRGGQAPSTPQEKIKGGSLRQLRPPSALQPPFFCGGRTATKAATPLFRRSIRRKKKGGFRLPAFYAAYAQPPFTFSSCVLYAHPPRRLCIRPPSVHYYPNHIFSTSLHCSPCLPASLLALLPLRLPPCRLLPSAVCCRVLPCAAVRCLPPPPTSAAYLRRPSPPPTSAAYLRRPSPPPISAALLLRPPGESSVCHSGGLSKAERRSAARHVADHGRRGAAVYVRKIRPHPSRTRAEKKIA